MKNHLLLPLISVFVMCGCGGDGTPKNKAEMARQALLNSDRAFAQTSRAQGAVEAFRYYLLEEAVWLPNGTDSIRGRPAIVEALQKMGAFSLEWESVEAGVAGSQDLGYTWGYYTYRTAASGSGIVSRGKYLNVWKKDSAGTWKVLIDMGNSAETGN